MFSYRIYEQGSDRLLAICDSEIIGKSFASGEISIDVGGFYRGEECGAEKAVELAKKSTIINAVGNEIIGLLVMSGLVGSGSVLEVGGVLHAQVVLVD